MLCLLVRVVLRFPLCSLGVPNGLLCEPWGLLLRFLGPSFFGLFWGAQRGPLLPVTCLSCCFGHLRGPRGPPRFLIGLLTLIVLWGPASELSISVKKNLVRAFLYLFLDPARWLPAGGRCAIFPPPPSPSRSLSPPLLLLSFTQATTDNDPKAKPEFKESCMEGPHLDPQVKVGFKLTSTPACSFKFCATRFQRYVRHSLSTPLRLPLIMILRLSLNSRKVAWRDDETQLQCL